MNRKLSLQLGLELMWWILTALVAAGFLYPILRNTQNYPFTTINVVFIVAFITLTRYIFLLRHTWLAKLQIVKVGLVFLSIVIIFYLVSCVNYFQTYMDEFGLDEVVAPIPFRQQQSMINFIRTQLLFFGTGAIIAAVIFPIRMIISVWRTRNRGTV